MKKNDAPFIMTPRQAGLIQWSIQEISRTSTGFALLFYEELFAADPSLQSMFNADIFAQSQKLSDTLSKIADSLDRFDQVRPVLRELGRRHRVYGVRPEHYGTLTAAILCALAKVLPVSFDAEMRSAWNSALDAIANEMLAGAESK